MQPYLFPSLPVGPIAVRKLMERIEASALDRPTAPGRFTPREVAAHLADWEPILLARMRQAHDDPESTILGIDEGEMAIANGYSSKDWRSELEAWAASRAETIAWLRTVGDDAWSRFVVHNERGRQSLYDQANLLLGHDLYHIEQLCAVLP